MRVRLGLVTLGTLARVNLIGLAERTGAAGPEAGLVIVLLPVTGLPVALLVVVSLVPRVPLVPRVVASLVETALVVASLIQAGLIVARLAEVTLGVIPPGGLLATETLLVVLVVNARPRRPAPLGRVVPGVSPARALVIAG